jgi:hypothetical protein
VCVRAGTSENRKNTEFANILEMGLREAYPHRAWCTGYKISVLIPGGVTSPHAAPGAAARAGRSQPSRIKQILGFRRAASAWRTVLIRAPRGACTAHSPPGSHRADPARRTHCHPATARTRCGRRQQRAPPYRACAAYPAAAYAAQALYGEARCCRLPRRVRAVAG